MSYGIGNLEVGIWNARHEFQIPNSKFLLALLLSLIAPAASGQEPLQLATLQREALDRDPRVREFALQNEQSGLRVRNIEVERRPAVSTLGQIQYQSDVPTPPPVAGQLLFSPPKDTYDISVRVDQRIFDPALEPRLALAKADLAESQARLRVALFSLRDEVNEAFFTAALLQEQIGALGATLTGLETRLRETTIRVREGAAIPGEAAAIEATLLQQRQQEEELRANRKAALVRLTSLTGHAIEAGAVLALPALDDAVAQARQELDQLHARPEYEQFARARDRAARQQELTEAAERPQLSAYGRVGFGKPGLNFISDQFDSYALAGVQLQWKTWTWGAASRERDVLKLQQEIVSAEEAAFTAHLQRVVENDLAAIDRLQNALATDDRIMTLRDDIDRVARVRFDEGVITAAEYLDRNTERLTAQYARNRHRVELAQARVRLLTTLGLEVR
jgi:outer membrane protein TolC